MRTTTRTRTDLRDRYCAIVDLVDIIDELSELGFFPADDDYDETMPSWATDPRRGYDALAHTANGHVLVLESRRGDESFTAHLFTRHMVLLCRSMHFDATPLGVAIMLAALETMVAA